MSAFIDQLVPCVADSASAAAAAAATSLYISECVRLLFDVETEHIFKMF